MADVYDEEIDKFVTLNGDQLYDIWDRAGDARLKEGKLGRLFAACERQERRCGCPSQIRKQTQVYCSAATEELRRNIADMDGIPRDFITFSREWDSMPTSERRAALNEFATAQRLTDKVLAELEAAK